MKKCAPLLGFLLFASILPSLAQQSPNLEKMLDQVASGPYPAAQMAPNQSNFANSYQRPRILSGSNQALARTPSVYRPSVSRGSFPQSQSPVPTNQQFQAYANMAHSVLLYAFTHGGQGGGMGSMGGGYSMPAPQAGASGDSQAEYNAQEKRRQAFNKEQQARDALARTRYGDRSSRLSAASEAQQDANAARYAANQATSFAEGHSLEANNYAAQARNAADRAQEWANQARYNADTYNGN